MPRTPPSPRSRFRHFERITTRWNDNDAYGHVNNAVYYQWFDTAVNAWLIAGGLLDIEAGDPIGLVVETGCTYARAVTYPEPVEIGLFVERIGSSSVTYRLAVFSGHEDAPAAEGHFTHVYVDRATRRPVPLPGPWRERLIAIVA